MANETSTPAATLATATQQGALPLRRITLLGTMHGPTSAVALVRLDGGKVARVETGDTLDRATVAAIGEGVVILSRNGRAERLSMPGT
ncbi:MAG: type II secretion system protein N [Roseovarius sp.]|jgi:Tfp pilus assembly protein PilP|uniref:type II secretion system protein N n=1 Tax=Roseovarius sp. TaxID=1486281 RepID=UPI0032ED72A2